jgi:hypothetical protein
MPAFALLARSADDRRRSSSPPPSRRNNAIAPARFKRGDPADSGSDLRL